MQMLSKSMASQEMARGLISVHSVTYGVWPELILAAMRDCASVLAVMRDCVSVNKLAMQTIHVVYPLLVDIGCFSHTLNHVGDNFKTNPYGHHAFMDFPL